MEYYSVKKQVERQKQINPDVKIKSSDITVFYPYVDMTKYWEIEESGARFDYAVGPIKKVPEKYGIDRTEDPLIQQMLAFAGVRVAQTVQKEYTTFEASEKTGLDGTLFAMYNTLKRPFSATPITAVPIAYNIMETSVHNLVFGEDCPLYLPNIYSAAVKALLALSSKQQNEFYKQSMAVYRAMPSENETSVLNVPKREVIKLIRERLTEYARDRGKEPLSLLSASYNPKASTNMRHFFDEKYMISAPRLSFLMYLCIETKLPLDFLIAENFTQYLPCYYQANLGSGKEPAWKKVDNGKVLRTIENIAAVDDESRAELLSDIFAAYVKAA